MCNYTGVRDSTSARNRATSARSPINSASIREYLDGGLRSLDLHFCTRLREHLAILTSSELDDTPSLSKYRMRSDLLAITL